MSDPHDENLARLLRDRVRPLPPPPDAFGRIRRGAARRRRTSAVVAVAATLAVLAGAGGLYAVAAGGDLARLSDDRRPAHGDTPSLSAAPSPSGTPTRSPTVPATPPGPVSLPAPIPGARGGPVPAGFRPQSATFVSTALGWALGAAPCARPPCTSVVRTTDGGRHWRGVPAPRTTTAPLDPPANSGVRALRFGSPLDGFAFGPELWVTHDGAASWRRVDIGEVEALAAAGGTAYAVVVTDRGLRLFTTPVREDRWTAVPADITTGKPGVITLVPRDGAAYVLVSSGLGATGYRVTAGRSSALRLPCGDSPTVALDAVDERTPVVVCANGRLFRSADGGVTWVGVGRHSAGSPVASLAAPTTSTLLVAVRVAANGSRPAVRVTHDGGRTWSMRLTDPDGFAYVGMTTATQGFTLPGEPNGRIYFTYDAARSWTTYRFR